MPGASTEYQTLTVTGTAPATPTGTVASILSQGTKDYAAYVVNQIAQLNDGVKVLDAAVQSGNLDAAKASYAKARLFWERSSPPSRASCCQAMWSVTMPAASTI